MAEMEQHAAEEHHPGSRTYVMIAAILTVFTAFEVAIVYIGSVPRLILVFGLLGLMIGKFALVIGFYMHLIPDHRYFRIIFLGGLLIAATIIAALTVLFGVYGEIPGINNSLPSVRAD